jgi:hypothetical protein
MKYLKELVLDANYRLAQKLYALQLILLIFSTEVNNGSLDQASYGLMDAGFLIKC